MELGAFSISLPVKNLEASQAFYAALGFEVVGGETAQNWLIMRNGATTIGLFQGMFARPMLTFTPGWDAAAAPLDAFTDVRDLAAQARAAGLNPTMEPAPGTGPASLMLEDPDGHPILIDQHVAAPAP